MTKLKSNVLHVAGTSQGGAGYLTRIIKSAKFHPSIIVVVGCGDKQELVYNKIQDDIRSLQEVCRLTFSIDLQKASKCY